MASSDVKLEAISLLRFLPAGAAAMGEEVTRQDLRDAGIGEWAAPGGRVDDLRGLEDYDLVLPADQHDPDCDEDVIELRFEAG